SDGRDCELESGPDIDGDGCPDPVGVDGNVVIAGERRYLIGEPGDRIRIADWNCDGSATAAIVRPDTGEIFAFSDWVADEDPLTVEAATIVAEATDLEPPDDEDCQTSVLRRDGSTVAIDLAVTR